MNRKKKTRYLSSSLEEPEIYVKEKGTHDFYFLSWEISHFRHSPDVNDAEKLFSLASFSRLSLATYLHFNMSV